MKNLGFVMIGLVLSCTLSVFAQEKDVSIPKLQAVWDNGLKFVSEDKMFKLEIGGRLDNDWSWVKGDDDWDKFFAETEGTEFRRARLNIAGTIYEHVIFKAEYDFAAGDANYRDIFIGLTGIRGVGTIRAGHFSEPFFMDDLTSTNHIMFFEAPIAGVFAPKRNSGLALSNNIMDSRMTWAIGVFKDTGSYGESKENGGGALTGRLTGLVWDKDPTHFFHLGFAYSMRHPSGAVSYDVRPEIHLSPVILSAKFEDVDAVNLVDVELAGLIGRFTYQSEFISTTVSGEGYDDASFSGFYAQASYFLNPASRTYNKKNGYFGAVKPARSFLSKDGGIGAFEVAFRYSYADMSDGDASDIGTMSDWTAGLNWHLNANAKVMFNYIRSTADLTGYSSDEVPVDSVAGDAVAVRFHIDF